MRQREVTLATGDPSSTTVAPLLSSARLCARRARSTLGDKPRGPSPPPRAQPFVFCATTPPPRATPEVARFCVPAAAADPRRIPGSALCGHSRRGVASSFREVVIGVTSLGCSRSMFFLPRRRAAPSLEYSEIHSLGGRAC